jgi:hypothetical protein
MAKRPAYEPEPWNMRAESDPVAGLWYEQPPEQAGPTLAMVVRELWDLDEGRRLEWEKNLRRFGGKSLRGLFQGKELVFDRDNIRLNVTKAITETLTAKVGTNRPRPKVLTDAGNWSLRTRAKKLQKYLDGVYQQAEVYTKIVPWFRDAILGGTGVMGFFPDVGARKAGMERVFPLEILVDPVESINGTPQSMYRIKFMDRTVLARLFPKKRQDIMAAPAVGSEDLPEYYMDGRSTRMIRVVEGWHLAGHDHDGELVPGQHVIAVDGATLHAEAYEFLDFPFEFFHWSEPVRGFWGDSAVGEIRGMEKEINRMLQHIQKAMKLAGMPWIINPTESGVEVDKLTNEIALQIRTTGGQAPTIATFQSVHPQIMEHLWMLYAKAFEILGTNQLQASATKPPGVESGRALEALSEEHLVRFKHISKSFEDIVGRRFAAQFVRVARQLDQSIPGGYKLRAIDNKTVLKLNWASCSLDEDEFFLQTWPISVLPITPAGKTQEVERWQQNGWITAERAQVLLDFPDLNAEVNIMQADADLLDYQLERLLDDGKPVLPDPVQNLEVALTRGTYALERGLVDGTPEEHLDLLRDYLDAVQDLIAATKAPAAPAPGEMPDPLAGVDPSMMPPGALPPGAPMMPAAPPGM